MMCGGQVPPDTGKRGRPLIHCSPPCRQAWRALQEMRRRFDAVNMTFDTAQAWKAEFWAMGNDLVTRAVEGK